MPRVRRVPRVWEARIGWRMVPDMHARPSQRGYDARRSKRGALRPYEGLEDPERRSGGVPLLQR